MFASLALAEPHMYAGFGFWWLGFLIPLFWILILVLIFGFFGRRWRRRAMEQGGNFAGHVAGHSAQSTLAERFAQGDIDETEYRSRLEVLRSNQGPSR